MKPHHLGRVEVRPILGLSLREKPIPGDERNILVVAPDEQHPTRVGQLQPQKRVNHFHAVHTPVGVVSQKGHVKPRVGDLKPLEQPALLKAAEYRQQRVDVSMEIALQQHLGTRRHQALLDKRLERRARIAMPTAGHVEESRTRRLSHPGSRLAQRSIGSPRKIRIKSGRYRLKPRQRQRGPRRQSPPEDTILGQAGARLAPGLKIRTRFGGCDRRRTQQGPHRPYRKYQLQAQRPKAGYLTQGPTKP